MTKEEREKLEKEEKEALELETPPEEELSEDPDGLEVSEEEPLSVEEEPVVDPFEGIPELEGKTPEEAAHLFQLQKNVAESLKREADEKFEKEQERPPEPPAVVTAEEYYADPAGHTRTMIQEELAATVAPFIKDMAATRGEQSFDQLRSNTAEYPEFEELEPYIREYIRANKGDPSNINVVHWAYIAARGSRGLRGGPPASAAETTGAETVTTRSGEKTAPPQHRPSSTPVPDATPKKRPLTEDERRLAKEYKMTHDEYRAGLEGDTLEVGRVVQEGGE